MSKFKPMLACDWHPDRIKFPMLVQQKVDGVHALVRDGKLVGRSLKSFANKAVTEKFSHDYLDGICGEMIAGSDKYAPDLCRLSTGLLNRKDGDDNVTLFIFDYVPTDRVAAMPYAKRMQLIPAEVREHPDIHILGYDEVNSMEEIVAIEASELDDGGEGLILRDPTKGYKYGRCGKTNAACWRIKRMIEEEILITGFIEGRHNANEATTNELGRSERSTHKEHMIPNGQIGTILGRLVKDVVDPVTGDVLFKAGMEIKVGPGALTLEQRTYFFQNKKEFIGQYAKFKMFPRGVKDKPRFPNFTMFRPADDIVE